MQKLSPLAQAAKLASPTLVDRVVGYFSPSAGVARQISRSRLAGLQARAYEGASRADGWRPARAGASANTDHFADGTELRHRARAMRQNVPYVARAIDQRGSLVVGTGITPRFMANNADAVKKLYAQWKTECDADNSLGFEGLQVLIYNTRRVDGEVLIRRRPRRFTDQAVPVRIQVLEIDWLDTGKQSAGNGSAKIINGIQYDALGSVSGYWIFDEHPGEYNSSVRSVKRTSSLVSAADIIHSFKKERPGQGRGFSSLASAIARVRDLQTLEDSELQRKNLESRLGVYLSGGDPEQAPPPVGDSTVKTGLTDLGQITGGGIVDFGPGRNVTTLEPRAAPGHVENVSHHLHIIASALGVTYEMMTGDLRQVNFSSARIGGIDLRRDVEQEQWTDFIPSTLDRMIGWFYDAAVLAGRLPEGQDRSMEWSTPRWEYVNPKEEVDAIILKVASGLGSMPEEIRRAGYDPQSVIAENLEYFKSLGDLAGVDPARMMLLMLSKQALQPAPAAPSPAPAPARSLPTEEDKARARAIESMAASQTSVSESLIKTLSDVAARSIVPAPVEVHAHIAQPSIEVRNEVPAAQVSITNDVQVSPTPVEVRNEITAHAAPAQVVVSHPAQSVAEHVRDPQTQEILRTVTTHQS